MSTYPIKVSSLSLDHKGGTKSYHLTVIETADGRGLFINRWGKTGQFGELKVKETTKEDAWKEWNKKEQEKTRGGYYPKGSTREVVTSFKEELSKVVGVALFNKIGASAIAYLDPSFDVSGVREAEKPKTEDGELKHVHDTTRKKDLSEAIRAEQAAAYANNPMFGRF